MGFHSVSHFLYTCCLLSSPPSRFCWCSTQPSMMLQLTCPPSSECLSGCAASVWDHRKSQDPPDRSSIEYSNLSPARFHFIIQPMTRRKSIGDNKYPCRTPCPWQMVSHSLRLLCTKKSSIPVIVLLLFLMLQYCLCRTYLWRRQPFHLGVLCVSCSSSIPMSPC